MKVYTEERKAYELCADTLGEGGESKIYHVQGDPSVCAKIYKTVKPEQEAKLRAMVNERFNGVVDGHLLIAWPQHLLYDGNGNFVGYLMPFQKGSPLFMVNRPEERDRVFRTPYNWSYAVAVAYNIASIVAHTHEMGYVVGDMNNANFMVDDNGTVTVIDVDSFEFTDKTGHHFRCGVGLPEFVAPELQGRNLSKNNFTIATDNFALAVHIFILLTGAHPFAAALQTEGKPSLPFGDQIFNVTYGISPWYRDDVEGISIPPYALELGALPAKVRTAFRQTFSYNEKTIQQNISQRVDASIWKMLLYDLYQRRSTFEHCRINPAHVYLPRHTVGCPFCRVDQRMQDIMNGKKVVVPGPSMRSAPKPAVHTAPKPAAYTVSHPAAHTVLQPAAPYAASVPMPHITPAAPVQAAPAGPAAKTGTQKKSLKEKLLGIFKKS